MVIEAEVGYESLGPLPLNNAPNPVFNLLCTLQTAFDISWERVGGKLRFDGLKGGKRPDLYGICTK
jgi:hypothetical protein